MNIIEFNKPANVNNKTCDQFQFTNSKLATGEVLKTHRYYLESREPLPKPKNGLISPFALFSKEKKQEYSFKASFPSNLSFQDRIDLGDRFKKEPTVLEEYSKSVEFQRCIQPTHAQPSPFLQFTAQNDVAKNAVRGDFLLKGPAQSESDIRRAAQIIEKALTSKYIRELYERANSTPIYNSPTGIWKIEFVDKTIAGFNNAQCHYSERKVILRSGLSDEMALTYFVYELTNGIYAPRHYELHKKAMYGQIGCEEFVKESERIEWEGTLLHHQVMEKAIWEMGWSLSLDIYGGQIQNYEVYWGHIKSTPHADYWRQGWAKVDAWRKAREKARV